MTAQRAVVSTSCLPHRQQAENCNQEEELRATTRNRKPKRKPAASETVSKPTRAPEAAKWNRREVQDLAESNRTRFTRNQVCAMPSRSRAQSKNHGHNKYKSGFLATYARLRRVNSCDPFRHAANNEAANLTRTRWNRRRYLHERADLLELITKSSISPAWNLAHDLTSRLCRSRVAQSMRSQFMHVADRKSKFEYPGRRAPRKHHHRPAARRAGVKTCFPTLQVYRKSDQLASKRRDGRFHVGQRIGMTPEQRSGLRAFSRPRSTSANMAGTGWTDDFARCREMAGNWL